MRRLITGQLGDDTGETANLNYWAFWTGKLGEQQTSDSFIASTSLRSWHGGRLARHLKLSHNW